MEVISSNTQLEKQIYQKFLSGQPLGKPPSAKTSLLDMSHIYSLLSKLPFLSPEIHKQVPQYILTHYFYHTNSSIQNRVKERMQQKGKNDQREEDNT